jgi:tRNA(Ile)-lysidine synthase
LEVSFDVGTCDVAAIAAREGDGWEAAARSARYEFLKRMAERIGARFVATAHTADDQVETVLHRIIRGTGIAGLAGIRAVRPLSPSIALVRPMLEIRRSEVLDYLASLGQGFRTDVTNEDPRFTRNRLRHELLPALRRTINADVDAAILRLAGQAAETQQYIVEQAARLAAECVVADFTHVEIDCGRLQREPAIVLREVFRIAWQRARWPEQSMGFEQWQQLAALARGKRAQAINLPGNIRAECEGTRLTMNSMAGR